MTLVSDNIRYLRKLNGLTQEQFSRKINIKRSLLGAYEEARANPNQQNIQAIAKAFNTTIELLTRQDLRKLRETPNLSIPLGQSAKAPDSRIRAENQADGPAIRSDGRLVDADSDDPFQHPDFPDVFAQPGLVQPEPQPLASVLNKYYQTHAPIHERASATPRSAPAPPVIRSPERPPDLASDNVGQRGPAFRSVVPGSPADRLFGQQPDGRTPDGRQDMLRGASAMSFNNVYDSPSRSTPSAQSTAPTISVVMAPQFGEYSQRHQQEEFLQRLPAMQLPTLADGHYRAFEADDNFAFPGALLIGQFIRNWFDIADGKLYVLLLQTTGICSRRVYNQVKTKGTLLLTADRPDMPNRETALKDVLEVWEIKAFVSRQLPSPPTNTDRLRQLADELQFEVGRL